MNRYRFLLLAFFLANTGHAEGLISGINLSVSPMVANINSTPDLRSTGNSTVPDTSANGIRKTSPRNTAEVGNSIEPYVSGSSTTDAELNNRGNGARSTVTTKNIKTSSKAMSCKTYEGKTYDQGEAGYADCMRNIRTDRQGTRTVP